MKKGFKIGDKVYWRLKMGIFNRTYSGRITNIKDNKATVKLENQNSYGKVMTISLNKITKSINQ